MLNWNDVIRFTNKGNPQPDRRVEKTPEEWKAIDVLINNAGLASGLDPIQNGDTTDWNKMIDTNVKGLLYMSHAIIPGMIENGAGHIINIGSTAGKEAYENGNVYCATKHAVDALVLKHLEPNSR